MGTLCTPSLQLIVVKQLKFLICSVISCLGVLNQVKNIKVFLMPITTIIDGVSQQLLIVSRVLIDQLFTSRSFSANIHSLTVTFDYNFAFAQIINHFTELKFVNYLNFHLWYLLKETKFCQLILFNVERPSELYTFIVKIRYVATLGQSMTYFLYMGQ